MSRRSNHSACPLSHASNTMRIDSSSNESSLPVPCVAVPSGVASPERITAAERGGANTSSSQYLQSSSSACRSPFCSATTTTASSNINHNSTDTNDVQVGVINKASPVCHNPYLCRKRYAGDFFDEDDFVFNSFSIDDDHTHPAKQSKPKPVPKTHINDDDEAHASQSSNLYSTCKSVYGAFAIDDNDIPTSKQHPKPQDSSQQQGSAGDQPNTNTADANIIRSKVDLVTKEEQFPDIVPSARHRIISECIRRVWGIVAPRYFQIFTIFCMVYLSNQFIFLIRKTGEGKTLVPQTVAAMLRGVVIVLVPLIGLGSDQVNKCLNLKHRVEAYHVDENRDKDFLLLCDRLLSMKKRNGRTKSGVILFCSPQSLKLKSKLTQLFEALAQRDSISAIFIDEAHTIPRDGETDGSNFRPEFDEAYSNLLRIADMQKATPNICAMSATLPQELQDNISEAGGKKPTVVVHGPMDRRNIYIGVKVVGQPSSAIKKQLGKDYKKHPSRRVLVYSNSKTIAEGTLTSISESVLEDLHIDGDVVPLTGDCGIMLKTFLMACFCGKYEGAFDDEDVGCLDFLNLLIMPCTAAANCGVSSHDCLRAYRYGMPAHMIDISQEMGRVDRGLDGIPGEHQYVLYLSFNVVMNLFLCIFQQKTKAVRRKQLSDLYVVLQFLLLPQECYHTFLENFFEPQDDDDDAAMREPCENMCSYCTNEYFGITERFSCDGLRSVLLSFVFSDGPVSLKEFMKCMTENALRIYGNDEAVLKRLTPGNMHALGLQLVTAKIVEIYVDNEKLLGKDALNKNNLTVKMGKLQDGTLRLLSPHAFDDFNCM